MGSSVALRDSRLSELADEIHRSLERADDHVHSLLLIARDTGAWLAQSKHLAGSGHWGEWLADNFPDVSRETVRRYIQVHENWGLIEKQGVDRLSVRRAVKLIGDEKKRKKEAEKKRKEEERLVGSEVSDVSEGSGASGGHQDEPLSDDLTNEEEQVDDPSEEEWEDVEDDVESSQGELVLTSGEGIVDAGEVTPTQLLDQLWRSWGADQRKEALSWFAQFKQKAKPPKKKDRLDDWFNSFWEVVHKRIGRAASRKAFEKAVARISEDLSWHDIDSANYLITRMQKFAGSPAIRDEFTGKIHPATWLNQGRYDDDDNEWFGDENDLMDYVENG